MSLSLALKHIRLTLLKSNHTPMRTPDFEGYTWHLPRVGARFETFSNEPPEDGNDGRVIQTTRVTAIRELGPNLYEFDTRNSTYKLEVLGE